MLTVAVRYGTHRSGTPRRPKISTRSTRRYPSAVTRRPACTRCSRCQARPSRCWCRTERPRRSCAPCRGRLCGASRAQRCVRDGRGWEGIGDSRDPSERGGRGNGHHERESMIISCYALFMWVWVCKRCLLLLLYLVVFFSLISLAPRVRRGGKCSAFFFVPKEGRFFGGGGS